MRWQVSGVVGSWVGVSFFFTLSLSLFLSWSNPSSIDMVLFGFGWPSGFRLWQLWWQATTWWDGELVLCVCVFLFLFIFLFLNKSCGYLKGLLWIFFFFFFFFGMVSLFLGVVVVAMIVVGGCGWLLWIFVCVIIILTSAYIFLIGDVVRDEM